VFGPVLHVMKFKGKNLDKTVQAINSTGYGLTMGLHSRIDSRARGLANASGAGNIYVNRNMVGAVVGVQPFGGRGLSGTGPKAGGPHYLQRFGAEYSVSNNISAVGGNASLLSLGTD
jgi:RHH-type proline utilization regulon transcriptional repressor/proline dehydrogenase/delta 1-pyrroline-5-carboxylate dehydrogenase